VVAAALAATYLVLAIFFDRSGDLPAGLFDAVASVSSALAVATVGLAGITFLLWLAWSSRVEANAPTIGGGEGTVGPSGAILWWFVPFANLLVPFGLILGLGRRLSDEDHPARDGLVVIWWLTLLASAAAVVATWIELQNAVGDAAVQAALLHAALAQAAWLVAALFSLAVVRSIQGRENFRAARVPSWAGSGANVLAPIASVGGTLVGLPGAVRVQPASTPNFPSVVPVQPAATPTWGSPATLRIRTARRRSGGWTWAVIALFIVGFIVLPQLIDSLQGAATPVATVRPRPVATRTLRPSLIPEPTSTPATSASRATPSAAPGTSEPSPTAVPPLPSPPTASSAPAYLLGHVSEGDGTCAASPSASVPSGALAAVDCRPASNAVAELHYAVFESSDAARLSYDAIATRSGTEPDTGACFLGQPGETNFLTDGEAAGRVLCFIDGTGSGAVPRVVWVDERLAILGQVSGTASTLGDLFDWWKSESGPI
jgi:hypothetical protein